MRNWNNSPEKNYSSSLRDDVYKNYNCKSSAAVGRCCWMISMAQTRLLLVVSNRKENIFFFSSPSIYTRENRSLSQPAAARSMLQSIGAAPQPFLHCPCYWGLPNFLPFSDNIICGEFFRALAVWLFWAAGWFPAARRPCIIIIIQQYSTQRSVTSPSLEISRISDFGFRAVQVFNWFCGLPCVCVCVWYHFDTWGKKKKKKVRAPPLVSRLFD